MTAPGVQLPVARVTVHPDGALVHREGGATPVAGRLLLTHLPLMLDPSSVRVAVRGAELVEVRLELDLDGAQREAPTHSAQALEQATETLADLDTRLASLTEERSSLTDLAPSLGDDPEADLPTPDRLARWPAIEQALGDWAAELDEQVRTLQRDREDLHQQIATLTHAVQSQSSEVWWRQWAPTRRAVLALEGEGEVQVALSYRVRGATWTPAYALDADRLLRSGRFTMRALVVQASGEDWNGVSLALSTAPCARTVDLPELPALKLGTRQSPPRPAWRELPLGLDALFPDDLGPAAAASAPTDTFGAALDGLLEDDITGDELTENTFFDDEDATLVRDAPPPPPQRKRAHRAPPVPMAAETAMPMQARAGGLLRSLLPSGSTAPPAPQSAPMPVAASASLAAGSFAPEPEPELTSDTLDYGRLRMAGWQAAPGERGRLRGVEALDEVTEAGLPAAARRRLRACLLEALELAHGATDRPLPPHHVLPGPVGGTDFRWQASGGCDIPSDGRFHSVAIYTAPVDLEVSYRAVPRHDPRAFRRVETDLHVEGPLVAGPVDVFVDGSLELTTPWAGTPGRGRLELGLGVEDRLILARNVRYREESAGLLGGSRRVHTTIEVQVASSLPRAVRLELLERVPVPEDADSVTVEVTSASPNAEPYEGERDGPMLDGGRCQWVSIGPGAEARAVLSYSVTLHGKEELVGGDRRG